MVSLDRARECIGRRIRHVSNTEVRGMVERVSDLDVYVREADGSVTPCIPENLEWVSALTDELKEHIAAEIHYETPQVFFTPSVYADESDEDMGYDEQMPGLAVVGSSAIANDDESNHPLYVIAYAMRRVFPVRITAMPDVAWEIEELLGWARP